MAKVKFDGIIEGVRYNPDGQIAWVRLYQRRGPTFSDREIWDRQNLIATLKSGKRIVFGERQPLMASTFNVRGELRLVQHRGQDVLVTGEAQSEHDLLSGVPQI